MEDGWRLVKHDPEWNGLFLETALPLRQLLGTAALRIDHVGSTSIAGLDAKPIIDIQISVERFDDMAIWGPRLEEAGLEFRADNPDRTKRYFREKPGKRRTHIHVRQAGSFAEQMTLLFRDYLRGHPKDCMDYALEKHRLMELYRDNRAMYVEGKGPIVWAILRKAHEWSQAAGWKPGPSDG
ncbi:GrpB family protein [Paenibacillus ginsengarvi]|uniref:GrpB family protein n=1 Tax=Paenibacillus ginsengarvi TaxID=400777 RepID=A0A3B0CS88_9BACL|nr:GrpB family protein [Paenibacillus ginsengarvi]RKN86840.1 GrpB family protein [Paenibacillus ginsengarvi]